MSWLEQAQKTPKPFVEIDGQKITFTIQSDPIKEVGVNGCQLDALIVTAKDMIAYLNAKFPCRENSLAITKLEEALMWLEARTKDREFRGVEGTNQA